MVRWIRWKRNMGRITWNRRWLCCWPAWSKLWQQWGNQLNFAAQADMLLHTHDIIISIINSTITTQSLIHLPWLISVSSSLDYKSRTCFKSWQAFIANCLLMWNSSAQVWDRTWSSTDHGRIVYEHKFVGLFPLLHLFHFAFWPLFTMTVFKLLRTFK